MAITTLADVQTFITTLDLTDCLWHADDDILKLEQLEKELKE